MRPVQLATLALIAASPTAMALELDRTRWVGPQPGALQAILVRHDASYRLVSDGGVASDALRIAKAGTLLLQLRMNSETTFNGTAYTYSAPNPTTCSLPYPVTGQVGANVIQWSGHEPMARDPLTCRVTRTSYTTRSMRLLSTPVPAKSGGPPPKAPAVEAQLPRSPETVAGTVNPPVAGVAIMLGTLVLIVASLIFIMRVLLIHAQTILAGLRLTLAEKRAHLRQASQDGLAIGNILTADELEDLLALTFPDLEETLRSAVARTVVAAIRDKVGA